jgi:hypothetical protein
MNADREIVLEEALQQSLTQLKARAWSDIEALSAPPDKPLPDVNTIFDKPAQDLQHANLLNSMLDSTKRFELEQSDPRKCEDATAFRQIVQFFECHVDRFLRTNPVYCYNFSELIPELELISRQKIVFVDEFLPYFTVPVSSHFFVKLVFSLDHQPTFVVVHGASEGERSPFEQSDFRVFRTLAVYFSRVLPDFLLKYRHRGIVDFVTWLQCYADLFTTPCYKCEKFMERDLTGDILPPIIRNVGSCYAFHIKCAPLEIELPDFGYVTLLSEEQMHEEAQLGSRW